MSSLDWHLSSEDASSSSAVDAPLFPPMPMRYQPDAQQEAAAMRDAPAGWPCQHMRPTSPILDHGMMVGGESHQSDALHAQFPPDLPCEESPSHLAATARRTPPTPTHTPTLTTHAMQTEQQQYAYQQQQQVTPHQPFHQQHHQQHQHHPSHPFQLQHPPPPLYHRPAPQSQSQPAPQLPPFDFSTMNAMPQPIAPEYRQAQQQQYHPQQHLPPPPPLHHPQTCLYCQQSYESSQGIGPYCSHGCVEKYYTERQQVKSELTKSSPRRKMKGIVPPLSTPRRDTSANMAPTQRSPHAPVQSSVRTTMAVTVDAPVVTAATEAAPSEPAKKRKRAPKPSPDPDHLPQPTPRVKQELPGRPLGSVSTSVMRSPPILPELTLSNEHPRPNIAMGVITTPTMRPVTTATLAAVPVTSMSTTAHEMPMTSNVAQRHLAHVTESHMGHAHTTASEHTAMKQETVSTHGTVHPHDGVPSPLVSAIPGLPSAAARPRRLSVESIMSVAAGCSSNAQSLDFYSHPSAIPAPSMRRLSLSMPHAGSEMFNLVSPPMYGAGGGGFNSPHQIFRQTGGGPHSMILHQDPTPEPPSANSATMAMSFRHTTPPMHVKSLFDVPMHAMTLSTAADPTHMQMHQRRSSISKIMETDEEREEREDTSRTNSPSVASSSLSRTPHLTPMTSQSSLPAMTISSSAGPSPFATPTHSMRHLSSVSSGSAPSTPLRRFFPFGSAPVVTLVPSPRMESRLQQAASLTLGSRARLKKEAREAGDDPHDEAMHADDDDEDYDDDSSHSTADREADAAAAAARRKKRARRDRDASRSRKKKASRSPDVPSLKSVASALARASRISRRKSSPTGDLSDSAAASSIGVLSGAEHEHDSPEADLPKDKECEQCKRKHAGTYGGGRFCGAHCARHFSIVHRWEKKQAR